MSSMWLPSWVGVACVPSWVGVACVTSWVGVACDIMGECGM